MVCVVLWWLRRSNLTKSAVFICLRLQVQVYRFLHLKLISRQVTETAESWNAGPFFGLASLSSSVVVLAWYILFFFLSVWISGSVAVLVAVVLWFYLVADIVLSRNVATHVVFVSCADMHRRAPSGPSNDNSPDCICLVCFCTGLSFATLKYLHTL